MMRVSIVVPAHNEEKYIGPCLTALRREITHSGYQTEIIVVDNLSIDATREKALKHKGVTVVDEPFKGRVQARRAGFVVAGGDIIACIDADVVVPQGWLTVAVREFERNPSLAALSGPFSYPRLDVINRALVLCGYALGYLLNSIATVALGRGLLLHGGNFFVRKEAVRRAGGLELRPTFWGDDAHLARRLSRVGRVAWVPALGVEASGRQLRKEGVVIVGVRNAVNYGRAAFSFSAH